MNKNLFKNYELIAFFILSINALLDVEKLRDTIYFEKTREQVQNKNTIEFVREEFEYNIDLDSRYDGEFGHSFNEKMAEISKKFHNNERRRIFIDNNGLCLLIAYSVELVKELFHKLSSPESDLYD